jgi:hypothetical protein
MKYQCEFEEIEREMLLKLLSSDQLLIPISTKRIMVSIEDKLIGNNSIKSSKVTKLET